MKILIVDDSETFRIWIAELITCYCRTPEMKHAASVAEGIQFSLEFKADAVLLDLGLPDGMGWDVLKEIRKNPRPVLVIVLTNYSSDQFRQRALKEGADYFLDKSDDFEKAMLILKEEEKHLGPS